MASKIFKVFKEFKDICAFDNIYGKTDEQLLILAINKHTDIRLKHAYLVVAAIHNYRPAIAELEDYFEHFERFEELKTIKLSKPLIEFYDQEIRLHNVYACTVMALYYTMQHSYKSMSCFEYAGDYKYARYLYAILNIQSLYMTSGYTDWDEVYRALRFALNCGINVDSSLWANEHVVEARIKREKEISHEQEVEILRMKEGMQVFPH